MNEGKNAKSNYEKKGKEALKGHEEWGVDPKEHGRKTLRSLASERKGKFHDTRLKRAGDSIRAAVKAKKYNQEPLAKYNKTQAKKGLAAVKGKRIGMNEVSRLPLKFSELMEGSKRNMRVFKSKKAGFDDTMKAAAKQQVRREGPPKRQMSDRAIDFQDIDIAGKDRRDAMKAGWAEKEKPIKPIQSGFKIANSHDHPSIPSEMSKTAAKLRIGGVKARRRFGFNKDKLP